MAPFPRLPSTLLFGLAANTDNLAVGLAYGLKRRRLGWLANFCIAAATTAVTLLALALGRELGHLLPAHLPAAIGAGLLVGLGLWGLVGGGGLGADRFGAAAARFAGRAKVGLGESLVLAAALSVNNVALAIAGGIGGLGYAPTAVSIFFWSVAMLSAGLALSARLAGLPLAGRLLRSPRSGDVVLLLAGAVMLIGY